MHINDINSVSLRMGLDKQFAGRNARVVVALPKDGKKFYIGLRGTTEDRSEAFVYDYDQHGVGEQAQQVMIQMGVKPEVIEVL